MLVIKGALELVWEQSGVLKIHIGRYGFSAEGNTATMIMLASEEW